MLSVGLFIEVG